MACARFFDSRDITKIRGAFHLPRNSGNSSWDVNGTHIFCAFHWKNPGNKWNFEKVVLFSLWKLSSGNVRSIYDFSQGITSSRLFTYLCHRLEFWWREHERMELVSNGTRSSLDWPLHGSFSKFLVNGRRPRSRKTDRMAMIWESVWRWERGPSTSLSPAPVCFATVFMISPHFYLGAWNRLAGSLPVLCRFWNSIICNHFFRALIVNVEVQCYYVFEWLIFRNFWYFEFFLLRTSHT